MSVGLDITGTTSRRVTIRAGEVAVVGRSPWADVSLPDEPDLADEHFRLDCTGTDCVLTPVDGRVLRNGVKTDGTPLANGDVVAAGGAEFRVQVTGLTQSAGTRSSLDTGPTTSRPSEFEAVVRRAGLSVVACGQLVDDDVVGSFDAIRSAGLDRDACGFGVAALPAVEAMTCVVRVLQKTTGCDLSEVSQSLSADDVARRAERGIARSSRRAPEQWLWKAVRWQQGSLTAPDLPPVPAPPELFARGVVVAVALANGTVRGEDVWSLVLDALRKRLLELEAPPCDTVDRGGLPTLVEQEA